MRFILLIASILLCATVCSSGCCLSQTIDFPISVKKRCTDYPGGYESISTAKSPIVPPAVSHLFRECKASICGDGKPHEGSCCGIGTCNLAGKNRFQNFTKMLVKHMKILTYSV